MSESILFLCLPSSMASCQRCVWRKIADPGEYGVESYYCRLLCCFVYVWATDRSPAGDAFDWAKGPIGGVGRFWVYRFSKGRERCTELNPSLRLLALLRTVCCLFLSELYDLILLRGNKDSESLAVTRKNYFRYYQKRTDSYTAGAWQHHQHDQIVAHWLQQDPHLCGTFQQVSMPHWTESFASGSWMYVHACMSCPYCIPLWLIDKQW